VTSPSHGKVNLAAALARIDTPWSPRLVASLNGQHVRAALLRGEFVRHAHAAEDEMFLVLEGRLRLRMSEGDVVLGPGELFVVPRGVEHLPIAEPEARVLLFEPASTVNTGDAPDPRRVDTIEPL
jgi:mannose-6-phosphate isomerase-like protein (cupin superfamily)